MILKENSFIAVFLLTTFYFTYKIILKRQRVRRVRTQVFPDEFEKNLFKYFPPYTFLSPLQRERLKLKILFFIEFKNFWSDQGVVVDDFKKVIISAHACLLTLKDSNLNSFPRFTNIYIVGGSYIEKENFVDIRTMRLKYKRKLGESWVRGPLVLSWDSIEETLNHWNKGQNVIFHEFTHKLDALDNGMDGTPILKNSKNYRIWELVMTKNFLELKKRARNHQKSDIDFYGITNEAEFFAVTVESFFCHSKILERKHPDLYCLYRDYFELDPVTWNLKTKN